MEVRETGACGISEKEFAIDLSGLEIEKFRRLVAAAQAAGGDFPAEYAAELDGLLLEKKNEASFTLDLKEEKMHQVYRMVQAAQASGNRDVVPDFAEEAVAYIQHVVGIE